MNDRNLVRVGLTMVVFSGPALGFSLASGGLIFVPLALLVMGFFITVVGIAKMDEDTTPITRPSPFGRVLSRRNANR